jgi:hypothetical protein
MTVHQGGEQDGLTIISRWSLKPLSAELLKWSYLQYDTVGYHHRAIFYGWLSYGDNQPGPVQNRTGIRPRRRLGVAASGSIKVDVFFTHPYLSLLYAPCSMLSALQ